jgi:hypothetical protein
MLITVDLEHPENDVEVIGLQEGETLEARLGSKGYAAYRIFGAAARLLFLALQNTSKPDIAAATEMMVEKESNFIRQHLSQFGRASGSGTQPQRGGGQGGQRGGGGQRPQRGGRDRGRR